MATCMVRAATSTEPGAPDVAARRFIAAVRAAACGDSTQVGSTRLQATPE